MADFGTQPQPRTFAPSKEDVLQNLMYFFGAPVSPEKLKDYSEHHAMTCALRRLKLTTHSRTHASVRYSRVILCVRRPLPGCAFATCSVGFRAAAEDQ